MDPLAATGSASLDGLDVAQKKKVWIQEQNSLKQKLVCTDDFSWRIPEKFGYGAVTSGTSQEVSVSREEKMETELGMGPSQEEKVTEQFETTPSQEEKAERKVTGDEGKQETEGTGRSQEEMVTGEARMDIGGPEQKVTGDKMETEGEFLRYIGGMDLSFIKEDETLACSALVVVDVTTMETVYEDFEIVTLEMPYIPGFLAFRESPALLKLLNKLKASPTESGKYPQLLMIDGNGILHPRGFGLASHLGVIADIPTLGIGKTLFEVDGLDERIIKKKSKRTLLKGGDSMELVGRSKKVWGAALRSTQECFNPVFVSIGHRISLQTGLEIVKKCCQFRIPEPVRLADKKSREYLRVNGYTQS